MDGGSDTPCERWLDDWSVVERCCADAAQFAPDPDDPEQVAARADVLDYVTEVLWNLTHRRYGICETTRRPCPRCSRHPRRPCGCGRLPTLDLDPYAPVVGVDEVLIDGDVLPADAYRLVGWRYLLRTDGQGWPPCSDDSTPEAFLSTWRYGIEVTVGGRIAAAHLACDLAKGCIGLECEVPRRATQIVDEGVTLSWAPSLDDFLTAGRTGVRVTDQWLQSIEIGTRPPSEFVDPLATPPEYVGEPPP